MNTGTTWRGLAAVTAALSLAACGEAAKQRQNELPKRAAAESERCYDRADLKMAASLASPRLARDVLVLIDQTSVLPDDVRSSVVDQAAALARPGTRLTVGTFSSYTGTAHAQIAAESVLEPAYPDEARGDAPMKALRALEQCLKDRSAREAARVQAALEAALDSPRTDVQRSDILANVKGFASRVQTSPADEKIMLLVSDLLENSSAVSFYSAGAMRVLDPAKEMEKARRNDLLAGLKGVRVYVVGGGLPPPGIKAARSLLEVQSLERFWKDYFAASGAASAEIGTPRLHQPIG